MSLDHNSGYQSQKSPEMNSSLMKKMTTALTSVSNSI